MSKVVITPRTKTVWHKNPISGHEWSTYETLSGFEVWGGGFFMTTHTTEKGAIKEKDLRESMQLKYPFKMPRSKREIAKSKKLKN